MASITSERNLLNAFHWICQRRKESHSNNDVWHLRFHWSSIVPSLREAMRMGTYRFSPCRALSTSAGSIGVWCAQDALVLKAISLMLTEQLSQKLSHHCYHLAGKGLKACVKQIKKEVSDYKHVCRSDVNSYYATINHDILMAQLRELIPDSALLALLEQLLARLDDVNGELYSVATGINKGSPLSPLLGAIYLLKMDKALGDYCAKHDLRYYRYMDDWVILCKTRHQLRTAVKLMNQSLNDVKQTKHPFKTYIGKIKENGFDFLGYRIVQQKKKLSLAWKTWANHLTKLQQLYEQGTPKARIAEYVTRWLTWVRGGVEIDLIKVIREGMASDMAKGINGSEWLAEIYGRALGEVELI
ncbi:Reverse transcriptase (RNA-dependent DNA polymerase) [Marinomonas spartinae]|uniref:Reverse transcriptase (RNA-dependent DNA polymerase) n=2 Tax=Marinomonas spartinae TaxID=1792290 RepID=A0A1A8TFT3_9GAMM|nr:Reverse transcriptase (RNA-dependent DNA polymerase) [Marinomonas spartinae]